MLQKLVFAFPCSARSIFFCAPYGAWRFVFQFLRHLSANIAISGIAIGWAWATPVGHVCHRRVVYRCFEGLFFNVLSEAGMGARILLRRQRASVVSLRACFYCFVLSVASCVRIVSGGRCEGRSLSGRKPAGIGVCLACRVIRVRGDFAEWT